MSQKKIQIYFVHLRSHGRKGRRRTACTASRMPSCSLYSAALPGPLVSLLLRRLLHLSSSSSLGSQPCTPGNWSPANHLSGKRTPVVFDAPSSCGSTASVAGSLLSLDAVPFHGSGSVAARSIRFAATVGRGLPPSVPTGTQSSPPDTKHLQPRFLIRFRSNHSLRHEIAATQHSPRSNCS